MRRKWSTRLTETALHSKLDWHHICADAALFLCVWPAESNTCCTYLLSRVVDQEKLPLTYPSSLVDPLGSSYCYLLMSQLAPSYWLLCDTLHNATETLIRHVPLLIWRPERHQAAFSSLPNRPWPRGSRRKLNCKWNSKIFATQSFVLTVKYNLRIVCVNPDPNLI